MIHLEQSSSYKLGELGVDAQRLYAHECRIRNAFAKDFKEQRPLERVLSRETRYLATALRADLRSVDRHGLLREWEFKIQADHYVLGQILTYVAHHSQQADNNRCTESQYRFNEIDNYRATPTINLFAEYQPWKATSLRIEADNVLQQRYNRVVNIYSGPRSAFPLSYQDDRSLTSSASILISLRKTF